MKAVASLLLLVVAAAPLWGGTGLYSWYTGDFDPNNPNANGLANETDAIIGGAPYGAATYQGFAVPYGSTYLDALFTNNLMNIVPQTAYWEIRTGVSEGNGGTIIASGTAFDEVTPTGRSGFGFTEYTNYVSIPNMSIDAGTYWFAVVPQAPDQSGRSFNSNTFGLNGSNWGQLDNQQFWNSAFFGANFTNANHEGVFLRFSAGADFWVPEPSSLTLLGTGLLTAVAGARRRFS